MKGDTRSRTIAHIVSNGLFSGFHFGGEQVPSQHLVSLDVLCRSGFLGMGFLQGFRVEGLGIWLWVVILLPVAVWKC